MLYLCISVCVHTGHEKYFRTTAYGLTGHLPDYACLIVGANMGVVGMCKEHLGVALALKVPVFFVVTKVDIAPEHVLKNTVQTLASILKKPGVRKKPYLVRGRDEVITAARNITTDSLAPIFLTSAVTGGLWQLTGQDKTGVAGVLLASRCLWQFRGSRFRDWFRALPPHNPASCVHTPMRAVLLPLCCPCQQARVWTWCACSTACCHNATDGWRHRHRHPRYAGAQALRVSQGHRMQQGQSLRLPWGSKGFCLCGATLSVCSCRIVDSQLGPDVLSGVCHLCVLCAVHH
jgi:hypothetical protein